MHPGEHRTTTTSLGCQRPVTTMRAPPALTFSVVAFSNGPGCWELVSHMGTAIGKRLSTLPLCTSISAKASVFQFFFGWVELRAFRRGLPYEFPPVAFCCRDLAARRLDALGLVACGGQFPVHAVGAPRTLFLIHIVIRGAEQFRKRNGVLRIESRNAYAQREVRQASTTVDFFYSILQTGQDDLTSMIGAFGGQHGELVAT